MSYAHGVILAPPPPALHTFAQSRHDIAQCHNSSRPLRALGRIGTSALSSRTRRTRAASSGRTTAKPYARSRHDSACGHNWLLNRLDNAKCQRRTRAVNEQCWSAAANPHRCSKRTARTSGRSTYRRVRHRPAHVNVVQRRAILRASLFHSSSAFDGDDDCACVEDVWLAAPPARHRHLGRKWRRGRESARRDSAARRKSERNVARSTVSFLLLYITCLRLFRDAERTLGTAKEMSTRLSVGFGRVIASVWFCS